MLYVFIAHVVLMLLACTNFTLLNFLLPSKHFACSYFILGWRNGFGYPYVSDYSLPQIAAYIAAYSLGLIVYAYAWKRAWYILGGVGIALCVLGLGSFLIELSHWFISHHLSCIASAPIIMLVLWIVWSIRVFRYRRKARQLRGIPIKAL
jgi:hypothetical protein